MLRRCRATAGEGTKNGPLGPACVTTVVMSPGRDRYVVEVTILPRTGLVSARTSASEPTRDYSTWTGLSLGLLALGLAGAAMLVAADLSTLVEIKVLTVVKERLSGHGQHAWAMAVLGVAALPFVFGA